MMTSNNFVYPLRIHSLHNFGITPFGGYCLECNVPLGNANDKVTGSMLNQHNWRSKHQGLDKSLTYAGIAKSIIEEIDKRYGDTTDYSPWIVKRNISSLKCSCGILFADRSNLCRHKKTMEKKGLGEQHCMGRTTAVITTCGRSIEESIIKMMTNQPNGITDHTTNDSSAGSTSACTSTPTSLSIIAASSTSTSLMATSKYAPIESTNKRWIDITLEDVKGIFTPYKRVDESLDSYLPSLKLLMLNYDHPVITNITNDLKAFEQDPSSTNTRSVVDFFVDCSELWVKTYCREHVNVLDGKTRHQLQSFFDESILLNKGYNVTFNMRYREDLIIKELKTIIKMSWDLYESRKGNDSWLAEVEHTINAISSIEAKYHGVANLQAVQEMVQNLLIQYYLHSILIERRTNAYVILLGHRMVFMRLFKIKRSSSSGGSESLSMVNCSEFASTISLHIHIYRLASASLMACTQSKSWELIIDEVTNSPLCHMLSPIINKARQMSEKKPNVRVKKVQDNGDIIIDDYVFPRSVWSQIIPKLNQAFEETLGMIFSGDDWKMLVDLSNKIVVQRIEEDGCNDRDDMMHYFFHANVNGKIVSEKDLGLAKEIHYDTIEKLTGLVMIGLHGTGLGSSRISELYRIQMHQIIWKGDHLYYMTESKKRGKAGSSKSKLVTHKLSASISRYLLLYDCIGREYSKGREQFLFENDTDDTVCTYENPYFYSEFSKMFDFRTNCNGLIMRHLYTQICNYLFPNSNNNFDHSTVSTIETVAEMCGHSAMTHQLHYSTAINEEVFFDTYHRSIGALDVLVDCENRISRLATESDILQSLQVLLGVEATFLSVIQKQMLLDGCNNHLKHTFCSVGCGGGKSMTWLIPMVRQMLNGQRPCLSIVIVPYCFLLDHHESSCRSILGQCNKISIGALKGSNIERDVRPNILRHRDSLPSILFVSLEAISKLVEYHFAYMEELSESQLIFKIYLDECHTMLSELNFRDKYLSLSKLAALKVPIVFFSGSFQRSFINGFMNYMIGSENASMFNQIVDPNLFGKKLLRIQHHASEEYIDESCNLVLDYMEANELANIHVIVSTKSEGTQIYEKLRNNDCDCEFIFSESSNQNVIASKWNRDKLRILISTTLGLVGNESSETQLVCIVGLLYNIPAIIQSIGRIRPSRRTNKSLCAIFTPTNNMTRLQQSRIETSKSFIELVALKVLGKNQELQYRRSMTAGSVHNWLFSDKGCRMVSLASRLGYQQNVCHLCDHCTDTCINIQASNRIEEIDEKRRRKEDGIQLLTRLKIKCIVCNSTSCGGNCTSMKMKRTSCFHCLENHRANDCPRDYIGVLQNKACYSCYVYNYNGVSHHDNRSCRKKGQIRERLRGLIQHHYMYKTDCRKRKKSFADFLKGIYASEDTFFEFLAIYNDWNYKYNEITCLECRQINVDHEKAPLLPPDDQACVQRGERVRIKYKDIDQAREAYKIGMNSRCSRSKQRKFLFASRFRNLFEAHTNVIDVRQHGGKIDLKIILENGEETILKIRDLSVENELMEVVKNFNETCNKCSLARCHSGDLGKMYAFGYHNASHGDYKSMEDMNMDITTYSTTARSVLDKYFEKEVSEIIEADRKQSIEPSDRMGGKMGISAYALVSEDLVNSAHYDLDTSVGLSIFNEKCPGTATNWNFALPNTSLLGDDDDRAIVIKLFDGCTLSWDGRKVFHCTSTLDVGKDNHVYGNYWGGKKYN